MDIVESIVSRLSDGVYPAIRDTIRRDIIRMIGFQIGHLDNLTSLERQLMIERIVQKYRESMVQQHEPVGVNAALTTGESLTTSSLQSHHQAGLKRGAAGFERIKELTDLKNKSDIVKVITTPVGGQPRDKAEINTLANLIVKVVAEEVIADYAIVKSTGEYPRWYPVFSSIRAIPESGLKDRWLRIYFDPRMMYIHRISLPSIASIVEDHLNNRGYVLYPPNIVSQLLDPYIDSEIKSTLYIDIHISLTSEAAFYRKLGDISSLQIGGITSVLQASPVPENLLTNISIQSVSLDDNIYEIQGNIPSHIPNYAWERMIGAMIPDVQIMDDTGRRFRTDYTLTQVRDMITGVPLIYADVVQGKPTIDDTGRYTVEFRQELINRYPYLEYADLEPRTFHSEDEMQNFLLETMVEYHFFWYIEAICSSVQELYVLPEIDTTRTYTTSPLDCRDTLGYLAMRNMVYEGLRENININASHLKLIVNNMVLYKLPVSIRRQDIRNDKSEWLTYTTFEEILKYVTQAAFAGEVDHMESISSKILTGDYIPVGRGGNNMTLTSTQNPTGDRFLAMKIEASRKRRKP